MNFICSEYLDSLDMFGIRLGLEATRELLRRAGNPERELRFLHIAGTNGKGSTGAMLECALRHAGLKTGFYTSPHLIDVRERFRVNGRAVPEEIFNACGAELAAAAEGMKPSYFEFATVLAALLFDRAGVDVVVWETGLGGRLDATNAVMPVASIITNIALDHTAHLGSTLGAIAAEKAGIVKTGVPLFCGEVPDEAAAVIAARAAEVGAVVVPAGESPDETSVRNFTDGAGIHQEFTCRGRRITLPLPGAMQRRNFRIVADVIEYFTPRWKFSADAAFAGLAAVRWPGRCEQLSPRLIVDGGHNPDGVRALKEALDECRPGEKFIVIYGAFADKEARACLETLAKVAAEFRFVPPPAHGRAVHPAEELLTIASQLGVAARAETNALAAVRTALAETELPVVVCGSLYHAGEVIAAFASPTRILDLT